MSPTYTRNEITVVEGLGFIRQRVSMFLGEPRLEDSLCARLVEVALSSVALDTPAPTAVRLIVWDAGVFTIAFDGEPLPVAPLPEPLARVPHPDLYRIFMNISWHGPPRRTIEGAVLSACSDRLVVRTTHGARSYRAAFRHGMIVTLLHEGDFEAPLGTSWLTFLPDPTVAPGAVSPGSLRALVDRVVAKAPSVDVTLVDRTSEAADWS